MKSQTTRTKGTDMVDYGYYDFDTTISGSNNTPIKNLYFFSDIKGYNPFTQNEKTKIEEVEKDKKPTPEQLLLNKDTKNTILVYDGLIVDVANDTVLVFLGNAIDKGSRNIQILINLIELKKRKPNNLIIILGNRDLSKFRLADECFLYIKKKT